MRKTCKTISILCAAILINCILFGNIKIYAEKNENESKIINFSMNVISNNQIKDDMKTSAVLKTVKDASLTSGIIENGIYLDGNGSYLQYSGDGIIKNKIRLSCSMWVKPKFNSQYNGIMPLIHTDNMDLFINCSDGTLQLNAYSNMVLKSDCSLKNDKDDKWYNIVLTCDSGNIELYINGKSDKKINFTAFKGINCKSALVGYDGTDYFCGNTDELCVYNKALNKDEVYEIYNSVSKSITDWDYTSYPVVSSYPSGISAVRPELFKESKISKPIETGFESRNEINAVKDDNKNNQLEITEDCNLGKFALKITKNNSDIIPIKESEFFKTSATSQIIKPDISTNIVMLSAPLAVANNKVCVTSTDKTVKISGTGNAEKNTSVLVKKGEDIAYVEQTKTDLNGQYQFEFNVKEYGDYTLRIGGCYDSVYESSFSVTKSGSVKPSEITPHTEEIETKCNYYNIMVKPMYKSENISFYVKMLVNEQNGNQSEQYVLIKSDLNGDGVFEVGEDLGRGKWQNVELNLLNVDEQYTDGIAAGIYMTANNGSSWNFDDITSGYKKINSSNVDLAKLANSNVVFDNKVLHFSKAGTDGKYFNNNPTVTTGGINTNEKLTSVNIKSTSERLNETVNTNKETGKIIYDDEFSYNTGTNGSNNYAVSEDGAGKRVLKVYKRKNIPSYLGNNSTTINKLNGEKRIRLYLKRSSQLGVNTECNGKTTTYNSEYVVTDWYDNDVTLYMDGSKNLNKYWNLLAIEYEKEESEKAFLLNSTERAYYNLGDAYSNDRAKITFNYSYYYNEKSTIQYLGISLCDTASNETYYTTRVPVLPNRDVQTANIIVPKIRPGSYVKIVNLIDETDDKKDDEVLITDFKMYEITQNDWDLRSSYINKSVREDVYYGVNYTDSYVKDVKSSLTDENSYAVINKNAKGIYNDSNSSVKYTYNGGHYVLKFIVLDTVMPYVYINDTRQWLGYGEYDVYVDDLKSVEITKNQKVFYVSKTEYYEDCNANNINYCYVQGLYDKYDLSKNNDKVYFKNYYDNGYLYSYNFNTKEYKRITDCTVDNFVVSSDEKNAFAECNGKYYYIEFETGKKHNISLESSVYSVKFNSKGEMFVCTKDSNKKVNLYIYSNYSLDNIYSGKNEYSDSLKFEFDSSGDNIILKDNETIILQRYNNVWTYKTINIIIEKAVLSDDLNTVYYINTHKLYSYDINTQKGAYIFEANSVYKAKDGNLICEYGNRYFLYNPVSGNKYDILKESVHANNFNYSAENDIISFITSSNAVARYLFNDSKTEAKYAMSFDGKNNWYSYLNGRWVKVSSSKTPQINEMELYGMTAEQVNQISPAAFAKLYSNGDSILTVDFAVYMSSGSNAVSPVVENIDVYTLDSDDINGLFGVNIEKFNKSDFRKIESVFPVENFTDEAQCYYILYIGNEWLYTYKNGKLSKIVESADELLGSIEDNWILFKQYGMSAEELRNIPENVLTDLFVNPNYANSEFGVIYVVKTKTEDTSKYTVTFKFGTKSNYIDDEYVKIQIALNGNENITVTTDDFSKEDIENLLSWLEDRQAGKGNIFYRIKNDKLQYLINYYMISNINIYQGNEYKDLTEQSKAK